MLGPPVRKQCTFVALVALAITLLSAPPAAAAPTPIAATLQLRGHLPELGTRPSMRVFQTQSAYESFRASLGDANVFPPASSLFMSFDKDILALYARGDDSGGRCLRSGSTATVDGDTVTLDLLWENGTCGAPSTARHPFVLLSLSRTASDGSAWVQSARSVCGTPPGVDGRACAQLAGGAAASPSPTPAATAPATPSPAAATPSPSRTPTPSPATPTPSPATPTPSPATSTPSTPPPTIAAPTVVLASPTPARSPEPAARPIDVPSDDAANYLLWAALGLIVIFVVAAGVLARSPRR